MHKHARGDGALVVFDLVEVAGGGSEPGGELGLRRDGVGAQGADGFAVELWGSHFRNFAFRVSLHFILCMFAHQ